MLHQVVELAIAAAIPPHHARPGGPCIRLRPRFAVKGARRASRSDAPAPLTVNRGHKIISPASRPCIPTSTRSGGIGAAAAAQRKEK